MMNKPKREVNFKVGPLSTQLRKTILRDLANKKVKSYMKKKADLEKGGKDNG